MPTPIEIGNRVWLDTDNDGIQGAGENGIPDVQVQLLSGATAIASATTAADGTYYFTSSTGTDTTSKKYGLAQLQADAAYTLKFPTTVTVSGTAYNLTAAAAGGNTLLDSNAPATGEVVVAAADIPGAGANNHSFDVGYGSAPPPPNGCVTITNTVSITRMTETDPVAVNNSASAAIQANCSAAQTDLKLTKAVDKTTAKPGDTVVYTLTVTNSGPDAATGVQVTDKLPAGVTFVTAKDNAGKTDVYDSTTGEWAIGNVAKDESRTLEITVTVQ